jgi:phosphoribosylanthranilate isomerase
MTQKPIIYVSRISNLSDARYCAGMGVDMLGFVVDPSHADYVSPARYQELVGWIAGPTRVIEITSPVDIPEVTEAYKPEMIHTSLTLAAGNALGDFPLLIEVEYAEYPRVSRQIKSLRNVCYVIINGYRQGDTIDSTGPEVLMNVDRAVNSAIGFFERSGATGLMLQGTSEATPGLKDYDHLSVILEELEKGWSR